MTGGYQVQVASFKDQAEAERFALELRDRGHEAHRVAANVPGRGLWHRVRIGPFKTKYQASLYKTKLEKAENITALVIDPDKVERQQQVRAAKLAERIRKYGSP
jgi:cell division septation protein DedD